MANVISQAFLFDSNAVDISTSYGEGFDSAFLKAVSKADPKGTISSAILRGDALVSALCSKVIQVSNNDDGLSWTQGYDMELYQTVIWDLVDAFADQAHTLDLETFPMAFAKPGVHCIVLPTIPQKLGAAIDESLQAKNGYLGAIELDLGNPLQQRLFIEYLIADSFLDNGTIVLERSWDGYDNPVYSASADFLPRGEKRLGPEQFMANKPQIIIPDNFSKRGQISLERFLGKKTYPLYDRVIHALVRTESHNQPEYEFEQPEDLSPIMEADLPEAKFVSYLLNKEHEDGSGKAKFFQDVLAIGPSDWRYLAAQFYEGLRRSKPSDLIIKSWQGGYGASFNCVMSIEGLNGRIATVFTNWIMKPGCLPQLSTARPEEPKEDPLPPPIKPSIVPAGLPEGQHRKALCELAYAASERAIEECVPTPMKVTGYPVYMDGMCGWATVRVPDARRGFARWLVKSKVGDRHYKSGAEIHFSHPSQSVDRALAAANAFAAVLKLNGIECSVSKYID